MCPTLPTEGTCWGERRAEGDVVPVVLPAGFFVGGLTDGQGASVPRTSAPHGRRGRRDDASVEHDGVPAHQERSAGCGEGRQELPHTRVGCGCIPGGSFGASGGF